MSHYENAVKIVQRLNSKGHTAYFAGGWVRDHVMGNDSDDIDIATSASPNEILELFPHTVSVGISFGVVIVLIDSHAYEVATFRRDIEYTNGRTPSKIEWCAPREDALRRDFTINGMFYDPIEHKIFDYVGGNEDIKRRIIRTIGDPYERFAEDRLRMVRAFRFSLRFGFAIDKLTQEAIKANADTLFPSVAMERVWQEFQKMAKYEHLDNAFIEMMRLDVLQIIFPLLQGMHLNELKTQVASFNQFSKKSPPLLYIAHLFPNASSNELHDIAKSLKVSSDEEELINTLMNARALLEKSDIADEEKIVLWVGYFAKEDSMEILQAAVAQLKDREDIMQNKRTFYEKYKDHILRFKEKKPLLTGKMLQDEGVKPGKDMGRLIREGQKLAIKHNMTEGSQVLDQLKMLPNWPKKE